MNRWSFLVALISCFPIFSFEPLAVSPLTVQQQYGPKNYECLLGHVEGLSDDLLRMHFKLYQVSVETTNHLLQQLKNLNDCGKNKTVEFASSKHELTFEFESMLLYESYFENLSPNPSQIAENDPFLEKIVADFGCFESWKSDFFSKGLLRGAGWVVTYLDPQTEKITNVWINEQNPSSIPTPLLVMAVFESAYVTQFGTNRSQYIEAFFKNIHWTEVSSRYGKEKRLF